MDFKKQVSSHRYSAVVLNKRIKVYILLGINILEVNFWMPISYILNLGGMKDYQKERKKKQVSFPFLWFVHCGVIF